MTVKTKPFDAAEYLDTPEAIAGFLEEVVAGCDAGEIAEALGIVARARGMSEIARESGLSRQNLYRSLTESGNPELGTLLKVLGTLNLRLSIVPAEDAPGELSNR